MSNPCRSTKKNFTHYGNQKSQDFCLGFLSVLKAGLEPARPKGHWILSPTCLPIPPLQQLGIFLSIQSERRDLNPRPSPWQGDALPLSYFRSYIIEPATVVADANLKHL